MNLLDYVLIVILGYCLVRGIFRGLIKELSSIVGVAGGFYAAYSYYPPVAKYLAEWITNPVYLNIISFLGIFVAVLLVVGFVGMVLKYLMNIAFLGWTDRISGALFGAAKGAMIILILISVLTTFLPANATMIRDSRVAQNSLQFGAYLIKVTPKEMKESFDVKLKELNKSWQHR